MVENDPNAPRRVLRPIPSDEGFADTNFKRLKPLTLAEIRNRPPRDCIVKGLLGAGEMSVWYGKPGCGKSFLMLDLARCVAMGRRWHERTVRQGAVLNIMCEGGSGASKRIKAMHIAHNVSDDTPLYFITASVNLLGHTDDLDEIIDTAKKLGIALIIIDTLNRAFGGGEENSSKDMGSFIRSCDKIREETHAHVAVVHHNGSNSEKPGRGHTSLEGAADTMVHVKKSGPNLTAEVAKNKDDEEGWGLGFQLNVVEVGVDEDGDPITSCVVEPTELSVSYSRRKLIGHKARAMDALHNVMIDDGRSIGSRKGFPTNVRCVGVSTWRSEFYARIEGDQGTKQRAFKRSMDSLQDLSRIGFRDDLVWIIQESQT